MRDIIIQKILTLSNFIICASISIACFIQLGLNPGLFAGVLTLIGTIILVNMDNHFAYQGESVK